SEVSEEFLWRYLSLSQQTAQRTDRDLSMQGHHAANLTLRGASLEHHVTAALTCPREAKPFQRPNDFRARDAGQFRHTSPRTSLAEVARCWAGGTPPDTAQWLP